MIVSKSTLTLRASNIVVDCLNGISDTDRRHLDDIDQTLALFDAAAPDGLRLQVTAYPSSDGGISVSVTPMNGTQGKSLLLGGLPWEAVLVTTAASLLQQV